MLVDLILLPWAPFLKPDAPWGLAVYRVSYSDNAAWERVISEIRRSIEMELAQPCNQHSEIPSRHDLVVMDNQSEFEGAGPQEIREHFNRWAMDELQRNWRPDRKPGTIDESTSPAVSIDDCLSRAGVRYNFCILVDDICLESLEHIRPHVIKLVRGNWAPDSEQDENEEDEEDEEGEEDEKIYWEGGETDDYLEDVGWMYIQPFDYAQLEHYLQDDGWMDYYLRPPLMHLGQPYDRLPGFWRRSASSGLE